MCGFTSADSLIGRCLGPTSAALKDQRVKTKIEWAVWIATGNPPRQLFKLADDDPCEISRFVN